MILFFLIPFFVFCGTIVNGLRNDAEGHDRVFAIIATAGLILLVMLTLVVITTTSPGGS